MQQHNEPQRKPARCAPHVVAYEQEYLAWYQRENRTIGEPFDPRGLLTAARRQWRQWPHLIAALERCTMRFPKSLIYDYFVPRRVQRLHWKFAGTYFLDHTPWGEVALDVIHDPENPGGLMIGGMEYFERIMTWPMNKYGEIVPPDSPDAIHRKHHA
ncbi:MAG: hypothetical protein JNL52_08935 [Flavobacteriales bacterium]|nr:hypothetical protein [Flavobacteriales bacterium]